MEHSSESSGSDDELMAEGLHLQAQTKKFLAKLKLRLRKRKPEEPSANDTQQKKPKESQEEIKLALTAEGFGDDVITVIRCLKERNVNRVALINKLWEADTYAEDTNILPELPSFSSDDRVKVSSLLLRRLEGEKEETEIAAVLAACNLAMKGPTQLITLLIEGGLIDLLMKIVNLYRHQADIVERGLFVASDMADYHGKVTPKSCSWSQLLIPVFFVVSLFRWQGTTDYTGHRPHFGENH